MRELYLKMINLGIFIMLIENKIHRKNSDKVKEFYLKCNNKIVQVCVYSYQTNNNFSGITAFVLYFSEIKYFAIKSVKLSDIDNDYSC